MNTAVYVDGFVNDLKTQIASGGIPLSDACWETALACVGWPYVFGAWGALCTVAERKKRLSYNPSHTTIKTKCKAWTSYDCSNCQWYPNGERTRCYDCRGFTDWILKQFGFDLVGEGATSQWNTASNWCLKGEVKDGIPQGVLVNLFIKKDGTMSHTGFYYNGSTCECSSGVQYFEKMKTGRWTHWAVAKCFEKELNSEPVTPAAPKPAPINPGKEDKPVSYKTIRRGNYGELVKQLQTKLQALGYNLGICGVDGDFGTATEKAVKQFQKDHGLTQDGVVGPKTWEALNSTDKPANPDRYTVTIKNQTAEEASALRAKYPDCIIQKE